MILHNVKVVECESKKSGTNQYGPWELFRIKIDDSDWAKIEFSHFRKAKESAMAVGMELATLEFTESQDGKYTNYTVDKFEVKQEKPKPAPESTSGGQKSSTWVENPKSMFYGYGRTLTEKLLELAVIKAEAQLVAAHVVYFAETLYNSCQGDENTLARLRNAFNKEYKASKAEPPEAEVPESTGGLLDKLDEDQAGNPPETKEELFGKLHEERTGEKGALPLDPDLAPSEKADKVDLSEEGAKKMAAQWVLKIAEVDNTPHLENWWTKACKSPQRKAMEIIDSDLWKTVCVAYAARKQQLKAEYKAQKEAEETGDFF